MDTTKDRACRRELAKNWVNVYTILRKAGFTDHAQLMVTYPELMSLAREAKETP